MDEMKHVNKSYDVLFSWESTHWIARTIGPLSIMHQADTYLEAVDGLRKTIHAEHAIALYDGKTYDQHVAATNHPSSAEDIKHWTYAWYWEPRASRIPEKTKCYRTTLEELSWGKGVKVTPVTGTVST